jgi:hypothetical protein
MNVFAADPTAFGAVVPSLVMVSYSWTRAGDDAGSPQGAQLMLEGGGVGGGGAEPGEAGGGEVEQLPPGGLAQVAEGADEFADRPFEAHRGLLRLADLGGVAGDVGVQVDADVLAEVTRRLCHGARIGERRHRSCPIRLRRICRFAASRLWSLGTRTTVMPSVLRPGSRVRIDALA